LIICQLHNYTNKGLFYFVPPLKDNTLSISSTDTVGEGIFQENPENKNEWISWFRIKESIKNTLHIPYLPLPLFFLGIIGILITILLIILNKMHVVEVSPDNEQIEPDKDEIESAIKEEVMTEPEKTKPPAFTFQIPDLNEPSDSFVYPTLLKKDPITTFNPVPETKQETIELDPIPVPEPVTETINLPSAVTTSVVLDPGSANRLFFEQDLSTFQNAYIASASLKKLPEEMHDCLKKVDLNLQDQTRISNLLRSLPIREEAAKAIAICKKMKIAYYITSYSLPQKILDIVVIPVSEWKQSGLF